MEHLPNCVVSANTTNTFKTREIGLNSGTIRILFIISGHSCKETEVVASFSTKNLSKE